MCDLPSDGSFFVFCDKVLEALAHATADHKNIQHTDLLAALLLVFANLESAAARSDFDLNLRIAMWNDVLSATMIRAHKVYGKKVPLDDQQ